MPSLKWTKAAVLEEAKKYSSRSEWKKLSRTSYRKAASKGWLKNITFPKGNIKWTKEKILLNASKYESKVSWQKNDASAYNMAIHYGLLDEASAHMIRPLPHNYKWTKAAVLEEAKKYSSRSEWRKANSASCTAAKHHGIFDQAVAHMEKKRDKWITKTDILEEAKKYADRSEWHKRSFSYEIARKNGWLEEAASHMHCGTNSSKPEKIILEAIKNDYPKAQKAFFGRNRGIANSFELDIYISELKKGIEFNGDYWHSLEGLKRGRINWPEEMLAKYHDLKREFFRQRNIEYIEIWESDWNNNQQLCLNSISEFLKSKS